MNSEENVCVARRWFYRGMGTEAIIASLCFSPRELFSNKKKPENKTSKNTEEFKTFCSHEHRQGIILLSDRAKMEMVRWARPSKDWISGNISSNIFNISSNNFSHISSKIFLKVLNCWQYFFTPSLLRVAGVAGHLQADEVTKTRQNKKHPTK